ncbi:MAG: glycosyltransferase [Candidatus Omnitrophota bacterium]
MKSPLFTVVMSTYNRSVLLPRAINCVLKQTYPDFELLVIDNGSTDNTPDVVMAIKDPRVIYVRNPNPTGSCDGPRNTGIGIARGEYTCFLDDDDIWYPERLEKVKRAFDEHSFVSAVCHNEYKNVDGNIEGILKYGPGGDDLFERLLYERNCMSSCATTVKTGVLRNLGGFDLRKEFAGAADYDLWLRLAREGHSVFFIDEPLGEYSITGENFSIVDRAYGAKLARLVEMHMLDYEKKPLWNISGRGMWWLFQLNAIAGKSYILSGRVKDASASILKALLFMARRPALMLKLAAKLKRRDEESAGLR